jgi:hypothetical protein
VIKKNKRGSFSGFTYVHYFVFKGRAMHVEFCNGVSRQAWHTPAAFGYRISFAFAVRVPRPEVHDGWSLARQVESFVRSRVAGPEERMCTPTPTRLSEYNHQQRRHTRLRSVAQFNKHMIRRPRTKSTISGDENLLIRSYQKMIRSNK